MVINSDIRLTYVNRLVKPPAVAGQFYPSDPDELQAMVKNMLSGATVRTAPPKALVAPHAGYIYSGPIAANAYAPLQPVSAKIKRVVLLGPAHRVYVKGMAISSATGFATPLGEIRIDNELRKRVAGFPQVSLIDEAFAQEHSLEVHLPFLQTVLEDFTLLPIVVGEADENEVAEVLASVWGGDETLVVISSDLSHFHDYNTARKLDGDTANAIKTMQYEKLGPHQACGCRPVSGLLKLAKEKNLRIDVLDIRNSGDTAGSHDRVVGYGSFSVYEPGEYSEEQKKQLLDIAHAGIEYGFKTNEYLVPDLDNYPEKFGESRAVFVTIELENRLRGCIGNTDAVYPLAIAVTRNAFNAAFCDPRFKKLTKTEFNAINLSISVLTPKQEIRFDADTSLFQQLRPGTDGLIIKRGDRTATFLPAVWEKIPDPGTFLTQLKVKAGIKQDDLPYQAWIYQSFSFSK